MQILNTVLIVVALLAMGYMALNLYMVSRIRKAEGKPAPKLEGKLGRLARQEGLFYFFSPHCGACRTMTPLLQEMARNDSRIQAVDVTRDLTTARSFGVLATPTLIHVRDGVVKKVLVGPQPKAVIQALLGD